MPSSGVEIFHGRPRFSFYRPGSVSRRRQLATSCSERCLSLSPRVRRQIPRIMLCRVDERRRSVIAGVMNVYKIDFDMTSLAKELAR